MFEYPQREYLGMLKLYQSFNTIVIESKIVHSAMLGLFSIYAFSRMNVYKYIRKLILPLSVITIIYRTITQKDSNSTIINSVNVIIKELFNGNPFIVQFSGDVMGLLVLTSFFQIAKSILNSNFNQVKKILFSEVFSYASLIPFVRKELNKEKSKAEKDFERDLKTKSRIISEPIHKLPEKGVSHDDILKLMKSSTDQEKLFWVGGKVSGAIYHGIESHQDLLNKAFSYYSIANPLHPDIWPSGMKFESEIIAMTASLVSGGSSSVCGCTTSVSF